MITMGSFFSGVGGPEIGLQQLGWKPRWFCEKDKQCRKVLRQHWNLPIYPDIEYLKASDLEPVNVIWMSPPCQDLSTTSGNNTGLSGQRSGLFFEAIRVFKEINASIWKPDIVIMEQVPGLLTSRQGKDFEQVLKSMEELGALAVEWRVVDGQFTGLPQRRQRLVLLAVFNPRAANRGEILSDAGESLSDPAKRFTQGQKITYLPRISFDEDRTRFWRKKRRARSVEDYETWAEDTISNTLNAFDRNKRSTHIVTKDKKARRLTPSEWERLMGWGGNHTDGCADTARYTMCGNGVMASWAFWIGKRVEQVLL